MKYLFSSAFILALILGISANGRAQGEVTLVAPGGIRTAIEKLAPGFESKTSNKLKPTFGSGGGTKKQVISGDVFDVPVVEPPLEEVIASGNVVAGSKKPLATVAMGVAVKAGAPKPDISTLAAVKKMLLSAKSITYPDPAGGAAAGVSFNETLQKLGIADKIKSQIKLAQGGAAAMKMVADGNAEIGLTFMSEMGEPGIDIVGPLPRSVSTPTAFVGFISAHAKNPAGAKALLDYLSSPAAAPIYKASGMQPGR